MTKTHKIIRKKIIAQAVKGVKRQNILVFMDVKHILGL